MKLITYMIGLLQSNIFYDLQYELHYVDPSSITAWQDLLAFPETVLAITLAWQL